MDYRLNRAIEVEIRDPIRGVQKCTFLSTWDSRLTYSFAGRLIRKESVLSPRRVFTHFRLLGYEFAYDPDTMVRLDRDEVQAFRVTPFWGNILKVYFYTRRLWLKTTWFIVRLLFKFNLMDTPESQMPAWTDFLLFRPFRLFRKPKTFDVTKLGYPLRKKAE